MYVNIRTCVYTLYMYVYTDSAYIIFISTSGTYITLNIYAVQWFAIAVQNTFPIMDSIAIDTTIDSVD